MESMASGTIGIWTDERTFSSEVGAHEREQDDAGIWGVDLMRRFPTNGSSSEGPVRRVAARFIRGRWQLTVAGMLIVVAIAALLVNRLRPLTAMEVGRIAEKEFLSWPGSSRFEGRYRVQPRDLGEWSVLIIESDTNEALAVIRLDRAGKVQSSHLLSKSPHVIFVDRAGKVRSVAMGDKVWSMRRGNGKKMPATGP
jgi:hypothetical protein